MTGAEPGPQVAAAADRLEQVLDGRAGCQVTPGGDGIRLDILVNELYDGETEQPYLIDDPHPLSVLLHHDGDGSWSTTIRTPVLTGLGAIGFLDLDRIGLDFEFVNFSGAAMLEMTSVGEPVDDPVDKVQEAIGWFIELVAELGPTGLIFAGIEQQSSEPGPTSPGFLELHRAAQDMNDGWRQATDAELATIETAVEIFTAAGLDEQRLRAEAIGALSLSTRSRLTDALARIERCDREYRELGLDVPELGGMIAAILGVLQAGAFGRRGEADEAFQRAEVLGVPQEMSELIDLGRTGNPLRTSGLMLETEDDIDRATAAGDHEALISAAVSSAFHHRRLSEWDQAGVYLEQAVELAERHDPTTLYAILVDLCGVQLVQGDRPRAEQTYRRLKAIEPLGGTTGDIQGVAVALLGAQFGDGDAVAALQSAKHLDLGALSALADITLETERGRAGPGRDAGDALAKLFDLVDDSGDDLLAGIAHTALGAHRLGHAMLEGGEGATPVDRSGERTTGERAKGDKATGERAMAERAMVDLLRGVRHFERARHQFQSARDRSAHLAQTLEAYELALTTASTQGRAAPRCTPASSGGALQLPLQLAAVVRRSRCAGVPTARRLSQQRLLARPPGRARRPGCRPRLGTHRRISAGRRSTDGTGRADRNRSTLPDPAASRRRGRRVQQGRRPPGLAARHVLNEFGATGSRTRCTIADR